MMDLVPNRFYRQRKGQMASLSKTICHFGLVSLKRLARQL